jgi:hypothetical protein
MRNNTWWILALLALTLSNCANVKPLDREVLSDPIMQIRPDDQGQKIEEQNRPRREGTVGGRSGVGGGCGC